MGMLVATAKDQLLREFHLPQSLKALPFFDRKSVADFNFKRKIGSGASSEVFLVSERASGRTYALKRLRKNVEGCFARRTAMLSETRVCSRVRSPFLMSIYSCFSDEKALYLQLPYAPFGDLRSQLDVLGRVPEKATVALAAQILLGLETLHQKGIVHCDLKPENVLISCEGRALISDFGLCQQAKQLRGSCGTPAYMAPEVILGRETPASPFARDVWAFGVLVYELLTGYTPFKSQNYYQMYRKIIDGEWAWGEKLSPCAGALLSRLLRPAAEERPRLADMKRDAFFAEIDWTGMQKGQCPDLTPLFTLAGVQA